MRDYSLDYESSKTFILNYNIENNQIIVNLASGEKYIIPFSVDNEKRLLERMKNQVKDSSDYEYKQEKRFSSAWKWAIWSGIMLVFNSIILATGISALPVVNGICAGWFVFDSSLRIYSMVDSKRKLKDIRKNRTFINNENTLSDNTKINQNVLSNVSTKTQELVTSTPEQKPIFTLNSIDKIGYEDLKKILENIQREEEFGFDYSDSQDEKPMILSKKRK